MPALRIALDFSLYCTSILTFACEKDFCSLLACSLQNSFSQFCRVTSITSSGCKFHVWYISIPWSPNSNKSHTLSWLSLGSKLCLYYVFTLASWTAYKLSLTDQSILGQSVNQTVLTYIVIGLYLLKDLFLSSCVPWWSLDYAEICHLQLKMWIGSLGCQLWGWCS